MKYKVQAVIIKDKSMELFKELEFGEIRNQKPDGQEILASMKRAVFVNDSTIEWYEECFCEEPLKHERESFYDLYFTDITTIEVKEIVDLKGTLFWNNSK